MRYDAESGQNVMSSLMDYCLPRADDFPMIAVKSNGGADQTNSLGVKGAGEAVRSAHYPRVPNAVIDDGGPWRQHRFCR